MAKENRMTKEEYLAECEKVEDTAYADREILTFGNELLLQNINAFGVEIANLSTKVRSSLKDLPMMQN